MSILTGSQLPAFIVPFPSTGVILVLEVFDERCECAFAASSTEADISATTSQVWCTSEITIKQAQVSNPLDGKAEKKSSMLPNVW